MEKQETKCPNCNGKKVIQRGFRKTLNRGKIQRYSCKSCGKRFVLNDGFFRMRNSPQKITLCLDLFFRGVSLRKVQEHLQAFYPHNSSHVSIYSWIVKYCTQIGQYTDSLKIVTSKQIQVDEMEYKTKGKQSWFIDVLDPETRYMVASGYYKSRGMPEMKEILKLAKTKNPNITDITTDGYLLYKRVVRKTFYRYGREIKHNTINASKGQGFVNKVERLHNNIRERTKTMRQFKSIESAKAIMKGYEIFYNFMRKHQAINCYPYELATNLKLTENNKWLELIKLTFEKKPFKDNN